MSDNYAADRVRVLRIIEYTGPREWVERQIASRGVKGTCAMPFVPKGCSIREAVLGDTMELLPVLEEESENVR